MSWLDGRQSTQSCIYVQRISSGGSPQWTPNGVQVHETPAGGLGYKIVGDGSGGVVVIWGDIRNGLSAGATLYAQRINGGGVPMWQANGVHVNDSYAVRPAAASDGTGGAIIAWQNIFRRVLTQRINGSGQVLWNANGVQIGRATRNTDLILGTQDGNGGAIFAWSDDWAFPGSVYVQRVDSSGALQWATNGIQISAGPNQQEVYSMLKDGAGGAILAWHDYPNSVGSDYDIFVQHVNASGVVQWKTNGLPIATATNRQWLPVISLGQSGDSIYAWEDYRDGGSAPKIYAQRVTKTGGTASQPQIISARILAEGFQLNWTAEPSVNYVIEARESVITGNWQQVVASLTSTGSVATATISQQGFASRFFRIKKE